MPDARERHASSAATFTNANPAGAFIWYELMTPDPTAAKRFYDAVVGWDIEPRPSAPGAMDYRMIRRSDGGNAGGVLAITDDMRAHGAQPVWLGYVHVRDVDATVAEMKRRGGQTHMSPTDIPNVGRIAMIADPQGAPLYVMTPTPPGGDPNARSDVFSPSAVQRCAWNELRTTDLAAAKRLYPEMFGWTLGDVMPMGPNGDYQFLMQDGEMIGAMFASAVDRPMWRYCFRVDDIERSADAVRSGGGAVLAGPMDVPGGGRIIQATDPQGAFFMLIAGGA